MHKRSLKVIKRLEGTTYSKTPRSHELSLVSLAKRRLRGYWISLQACNTEGTELMKKIFTNEFKKKKKIKGWKVEAGQALTNG